MDKSNAIVLTAGYLDSDNGKTAHGLIRGTERFNILGIIDDKVAGRDAGEVLDGKRRDIPVFATLPSLFTMSASGTGPGAILNANYTLNTAANATARGATALLFGTGEGQTTKSVMTSPE